MHRQDRQTPLGVAGWAHLENFHVPVVPKQLHTSDPSVERQEN